MIHRVAHVPAIEATHLECLDIQIPWLLLDLVSLDRARDSVLPSPQGGSENLTTLALSSKSIALLFLSGRHIEYRSKRFPGLVTKLKHKPRTEDACEVSNITINMNV